MDNKGCNMTISSNTNKGAVFLMKVSEGVFNRRLISLSHNLNITTLTFLGVV